MYPDRSSPTVAVHSIFACLTAAAYYGIKEVAKIDVKGAFIQTPMEGPPVYMRCNKDLTRLIVEIYPHLEKFVSKSGYLYCLLLKALYGCVQASKLWFDKLIEFLKREGYEQSPIDPCVLRRVDDNKVWLLLIYVDDVLVIADRAENLPGLLLRLGRNIPILECRFVLRTDTLLWIWFIILPKF